MMVGRGNTLRTWLLRFFLCIWFVFLARQRRVGTKDKKARYGGREVEKRGIAFFFLLFYVYIMRACVCVV
ncbi:hypothetical protein GGS23DRAFT_363000 [Durotheca rogersii]|uniref:uncharacterized protein n=1 Tax=Durotheca rogersii TaxID=419775 RepID=UPI00221ECC6E|nr:uncharacterized protein GGS23DRAFT_363000 [Durotheca rogersii]KAI5865973.1 hypothetical protein GGS23DRAFT_363000 [Durotheca rogersii]